MEDKSFTSIVVFFVLMQLFPFQGNAQTAIVSAGNDISGMDGNISYSVGQVVNSSIVGRDGQINQGVQQPYEIYIITEAKNFKNITLDCSAYPNPTIDILNLRVAVLPANTLEYRLLNGTGKLIMRGELEQQLNQIQVSHLVPSTYFIQIFTNGENVKTFKIIKH